MTSTLEAARIVGEMAARGATPYEQYIEISKLDLTLDEVNANWRNRQVAHKQTPGVHDTEIASVLPAQVG